MQSRKSFYHREAGISLLDSLVALFGMALILVLAHNFLFFWGKSSRRTLAGIASILEPSAIYLLLHQVVRGAETCGVTGSVGDQTLRCVKSGVEHLFKIESGNLTYRIDGLIRRVFRMTSNLELCDDSLIQNGLCRLGSPAIRSHHINQLTADRAGRLFLVKIVTAGSLAVSGALFMRNLSADFGLGVSLQ